jgi:hypothetical protein
MNKVSMDALNNGWALGFGTNVRQHNADFAFAAARLEATTLAPTVRKPSAFEAFLGEMADAADDFVASLSRFAR